MAPRSFALRSVLLAAAVVGGCYTGSSVDVNRVPDPTDPAPTTTTDGGKAKGKPSPDKPAARGLPCDVAAIVANACADCHGATPSGGARNRLVTYEDFKALVEGDPSQTYAQAAVRRMKSESRPMPPTGKLADESIAIFEHWVTTGLPRGTCAQTPDAGPPAGDDDDSTPPPADDDDDPTPDAGPEPTSVCTSGHMAPKPPEFPDVLDEMNPGKACVSCHQTGSGPIFTAAGTVFPTLHEPDSCYGATGVSVVLIDKDGNAHTLPANASGNFFSFDKFPMPYRAMVVRGSDIRVMQTPQHEVDCNGCHTEWGEGAPGRIMAP